MTTTTNEPKPNTTNIHTLFDSISIEDILNLNHASKQLNATILADSIITNQTPILDKPQNKTSDKSINSTTTDIEPISAILDFNDTPIIVEPEDNLISISSTTDAANLLFQGLQLSMFETDNKEDLDKKNNNSTNSTVVDYRNKVLATSQPNKTLDTNIARLINLKNRPKNAHSDKFKNLNITAINYNKRESNSTEEIKVRNSFKTENITKSIKQYHTSNNGPKLKNNDDSSIKHDKISKNIKTNTTAIKSREPITDSDLIKQSQGLFKEIVRHTKDVHGRNKTRPPRPASSTGNNSIKLIFERAKNRTTDYKIKLKQREHQNVANAEHLQGRSNSANLNTSENGTKVAGFLNNDVSSSIGDARLKTLKARILFKDLQSTKDFQQFFNKNTDLDETSDDNEDDDDKVGAETQRITNRIHFPTTFNQLEDKPGKSTIQNLKILPSSSSLLASSKTIITFQPSYELKNVKTQSYWNNPKFNLQQNNNYGSGTSVKSYHSSHTQGQQYNHQYITSSSTKVPDQEDASSAVVNSYAPHNASPHYEQVAAKEIAHFTTIENRPVQRYSIDPPPPLQNNYPAAIQNNPSSITQYYRSHPKYSASVVPASLPSIVHPTYNAAPSIVAASTKLTASHQSAQRRQHTPKDSVIVKIIPANGWYLNDENERKSYFDAVKRGLLNENGYVFVNNVHQSTNNGPEPRNAGKRIFAEPSIPYSHRPPQPPPPPPPPTSHPISLQLSRRESTNHIADEDEGTFFKGVSSYDTPLSSVGKLSGDSNTVSNNPQIQPRVSGRTGKGYYYHHPKKTFNF